MAVGALHVRNQATQLSRAVSILLCVRCLVTSYPWWSDKPRGCVSQSSLSDNLISSQQPRSCHFSGFVEVYVSLTTAVDRSLHVYGIWYTLVLTPTS